jgi:hypothetical protein
VSRAGTTARALRRAAVLLLVAWGSWGLAVVVPHRAARPPPPPGELRGAWHVHTDRSDGRGTLEEVLVAARDAGLQFVVIADHNLLTPADAGWHDGVLVIEASEASTRWGHVVGVGIPRALDPVERRGDPLAAVAALGGEAVLAHPHHARRPFRGWGAEPWRGLEVLSNDAAFGEVVAGRAFGRLAAAAAALPFDGARAVLDLLPPPAPELAALDAAQAGAPPGRPRPDGGRGPGRVLLCAVDAHGWPSYRAALGAFSMHVPVTSTGDGAVDAAAVEAALLDGRAACVLDGRAPAAGVRLEALPGGARLEVSADIAGAEATLVRAAGLPVAGRPVPGGFAFACEGGCGPGWVRAEVTLHGRPWIFTNPLPIE